MTLQLAMKGVKRTRTELTQAVIKKRYLQACEIEPSWDDMAPKEVVYLLDTYAKSIGVPKELIFCPLLTAAAGQFASESRLQLLPNWEEPPILWSIAVAMKGDNLEVPHPTHHSRCIKCCARPCSRKLSDTASRWHQ